MKFRQHDDISDIVENYTSTKKHEHLGDDHWEYSGKSLESLWDENDDIYDTEDE